MANKYTENALRFRRDASVHHNCAQAVIETFADECGLTQEQAFRLGAHFGGGMKMGSVCGAITGGLMVIGLLGGDEQCRKDFTDAMRQNHEGMTDCRDLLRKNAETGTPKSEHCDGLVCEAVECVMRVMSYTGLF